MMKKDLIIYFLCVVMLACAAHNFFGEPDLSQSSLNPPALAAGKLAKTDPQAESAPADKDKVNPYEKLGLSSAVLNAGNGEFIDGQDEDTILPLASLTKLMTALVLRDRQLDFTKKVTLTESEINYVEPYVGTGDLTSKINLSVGDQVTMEDLWNAMLIASSNEAAVALVDNSGLTRDQFVSAMNQKAQALGLKHTLFKEMSGIDPENISTAKEMALIARQAFADPAISRAGIKDEYKFKDLNTGRLIGVYSRNSSLLAMEPVGMKVGYLTEAKDNVAIRLRRSGKDRVVVVMHAANNQRRNNEISRLMKK